MTVSFFLLVVLKSHIHTIFDDNSPTPGDGDGETWVSVIITIILIILSGVRLKYNFGG